MTYKIKRLVSVVTGLLFSASSLFSFVTSAEQEIYQAESTVICDVADSIPSDDELLLGYFEQKLYEANPYYTNDPFAYSALGPSKLAGGELTIYNNVKAQISEIAAGKEASAIVVTPAAEFTYEQLGLDSSAESDEISAAIQEIFPKVYKYALMDSPYEFYWHDKGTGAGMSYSYTRDDTKVTATNFTLRFYVGTDYAGNGEFTVDTAKTAAAAAAAANAVQIVSDNAGKSNVEKLTAYKDKICELVTYDHDAADSNPSKVGVDPWQLIHVFDGDDTTNVVCEGYSKAFYYLCLLSEFTGYIDCWTVSGYMNGGAHMWNVVAIGSRNYLVDVTNCDSGSIGNPGNLFLKGVTGSVAGGYSRTIGSTTVSFTYKPDTITYMGKKILTLSDLDYSAEIDDSDSYSGGTEEDEPVEGDEIVIWANGSKNYKSTELEASISATNWLNAKGKTQKGKLVWTAMLKGTPTYDYTKHKVTTKSDKTVVTVGSKGKVTAKSGGSAIVYATDTGALESEAFRITVKNAPTAVFLFDEPGKTAEDKKSKLKSVNVIAGGETERVYISPFAKQGEVSADCTYTVTAKKNESNIITYTDVKSDSEGNLYFDVKGNSLAQAGRVSKVSLTVTCDQSGKKTSVNVQVYAPVSGITCTSSIDSPAISQKGDTVTLSSSVEISGNSLVTTDKLQAVVAASAPVVDSTGKKVTFEKNKQISVKMDKTTYMLTLKASKPVTEAAGIYIITTDAVTKKKNVYKVADIAADGTITLV